MASGEPGQRGLTPYLPVFLVRKLARSDGLPRIASEEHFTGATLFVDLAGFTQLTERLAGDGPEGAERLSESWTTTSVR